MKNKNIKKLYFVLWKDEVRKFYGVPWKDRIVSVAPEEDIKVKYGDKKFRNGRKYYKADSLAIFDKRKEAVAFWGGNKDWKIIGLWVNI